MILAIRGIGLVLLLVLLNGETQSATFGVRAGMNTGDASRQLAGSTTSPKSGYVVGAFVGLPIAESKLVRCRFELSHVEKGWEESGRYSIYNYSGKAYIAETVLTGLMVVYLREPDPGARPYLLLGPEVGFKQSAIGKASVGDSPTIKDDIPDWADQDPGFNVGFGIAAPTKTGQFLFEFRYNWGFNNIYEGEDDLFGQELGVVKLRNLQLTAAYAFGKLHE